MSQNIFCKIEKLDVYEEDGFRVSVLDAIDRDRIELEFYMPFRNIDFNLRLFCGGKS